jgi:hypothetical protein
MKRGVALPLIDVAVGGDPAAVREFAQTAEEIGYQDLAAPDHVFGVNVASRPDWATYTASSLTTVVRRAGARPIADLRARLVPRT